MPARGNILIDLTPYLSRDRVCFLEPGLTKRDALGRLAALTAHADAVADASAFTNAIYEREVVSSTGIGRGIAVPHAKIASVAGFAITIGISQTGIDFDAKDNEPVHILVMIAASDQERETYLKVLATVAAALKQPDRCASLHAAADPDAVLAAFLA